MNFKIANGILTWTDGSCKPAEDEHLMMWEKIEALQAQLDADKWISVDDRLPEYDTNDNWEYLVYDTLNNKVNHDYWICSSDGGQPFWNHYGSHVTHWQPLPEPPAQEPT